MSLSRNTLALYTLAFNTLVFLHSQHQQVDAFTFRTKPGTSQFSKHQLSTANQRTRCSSPLSLPPLRSMPQPCTALPSKVLPSKTMPMMSTILPLETVV
ncbi:hypothetical protein GGR57DRAFT_342143 [Xylariaceae sp. FL1272]|nr:hypothetical protein GGR57DRAFT_342143 [Xylariaceae sp. FL1272]